MPQGAPLSICKSDIGSADKTEEENCQNTGGDQDPMGKVVCYLKSENYKIFANIGLSGAVMYRHAVVLDTGAGPNCIRTDALPPGARGKLEAPPDFGVFDANGKPLTLEGCIKLDVEVGKCRVTASFIVCRHLQVGTILGTDFTNLHVHSIMCRDGFVEMKDGSQAEIIRQRAGKDEDAPVKRVLTSPLIRVAEQIRLAPGSQTWVKVTSKKRGEVYIEPAPRRAHRPGLNPANGVVMVRPDVPFWILVANTSAVPILLPKRAIVGIARESPNWIAPTAFTLQTLLLGKTNDSHCPPNEETAAPPSNSVDDIDLSRFPAEHHDRVRKMLSRFAPMWDGKLGTIEATEHAIDLEPDSVPFRQPPYRAGHRDREFEESEIKKMLKEKVIRPSHSPWASPVVLAPKGDGSLRFCVDYRRLNAVTKRDSYPLPRMDDCIDSLGEARYFTTLDANSGYWQLPMREKDIPKTAFVTHSGLYEYLRMPFGLKNAPASFQRALDIILSGHNWKTCLVYIDDIIVFSKDAESHIQDVETILTALQQAGVSLKFKKCLFFTDSVRYLGHIVRPGTLEVDDSHVKSLREAKPPRTPTELRSFLGFANVYRRFVPSFTEKARPLYELLKGNPKAIPEIREEAEVAFYTLITAITSPPVLAIPRRGLRYSLDTDASKYQVGCALFQTQEGGERRPIGFWSRTLTAPEKNYSVSEQECLSVIYGITTCRPYLVGEDFDLYTDHNCLRWLMEIVDPSGRLMRWRLRLSEYQFTIHHKKGYLNTQADAVSRLPSDGHTTEHENYEVPCLAIGTETPPPEQISTHELLQEQERDELCQTLRTRLDRGEQWSFEVNPESGILERVLPTHRAMVIPESLRPRLLDLEHTPVCAGHDGGRRMYQTLRRRYYWPRMAVDCYDMVAACKECSRERIHLQNNSEEVRLFPASNPLEDVAMDLLGELPRTPRGNTHLLVIVDRFTKLVRTVPLSNTSSWSLAKAFTTNWVFIFGPPKTILTDKGSNFTSKFMQEVHRSIGIKPKMTTAYHPQTNGQTERYNRTIVAALRKYCSDHPRDWDLFTDAITFGYNSHVHTSTGLTPFDLVISRPPNMAAIEKLPGTGNLTHKEARVAWLRRLGPAIHLARAEMDKAQARFKRNHDARLRKRKKNLCQGDFVWIRREKTALPAGNRHKLAARADGPYRVTQINEKTVIIDRGPVRDEVHINRVEKAPAPRENQSPTTRNPPRQGQREGQEGYVVDKITGHGLNDEGYTEFRVKWMYHTAQTWEPVAHLPYSHIHRYCKRQGIELPANIGEARPG